jgi:transcriptional regulator GlxA family with amidase domain
MTAMFPSSWRSPAAGPRLFSRSICSALIDALVRLVKLLAEPALVLRLAPLVQQEIAIRLLTGPHGPQLRHLVTAGSPSQQIAKAVAWLKQNFVQPLRGDDLANRAHTGALVVRER